MCLGRYYVLLVGKVFVGDLVQCVGVLIFAGVHYVPKLKEVVLILDLGFIM